MCSASSPIVIAGMPRSGTSLQTSIMAASGVDVGDRLVAADRNNRRGYFEDADFLELNRRILLECCDGDDGGHPDWGWTESESLDSSRFAEFRDDAAQLLERLGQREKRWGFKDPRTTLLLDFWHELLGDARYLLVYRLPWQVADSMQRLGADVFLNHPEYASRIWRFYNRRLLDFRRKHPERCLLVSTNALLSQPDAFARHLEHRLELELDQEALGRIYEKSLLGASSPADPLIALVGATSPQTLDLLEELDAAADLPATGCWRRPKKLRAPGTPPQPKLSVVIPCRDHGQFLIEAVASVERSIDEDYELIIVDDGSEQERTLFVLDALRAAGYRIERLTGVGLSAARNHGINAAQGEFVLPLDADNRLRAGFVEQALDELAADPDLGAVYGDVWEFGQRQGRREVADLEIERLLESNYIDACAVLRKTMWQDIGGYDERLPAWEDWDFWIRVATRGWRAQRLDRLAFDYRVRPNSLVSITRQEEVLGQIVDRITGKHRQLFEGHLARRVGHVLAAWPHSLNLKHRKLSAEFEHLASSHRGLEQQNVELRLQLERARIERLEAEKLAESTAWQLEKARTENELRAALLEKQESQLAEQQRRITQLGGELEAERQIGAEYLRVLEQIHSSRAFRLVRAFWRLSSALRGQRRGEEASASISPGPPAKDSALGG